MSSFPQSHFRETGRLARAIRPKDVFQWLMTDGYFPESYVLPPCFVVSAHRRYGKPCFTYTKNKFSPKISEHLTFQFPKTDLTDRSFAIIDPEIHRDIALTIARNWKSVVGSMFRRSNRVCSYSFPIPLDANRRGAIGTLRSGRMIYEFIEMAEGDLAAEAFQYRCLITTDIKNFYPSVYTHSIAWALHGKRSIRKASHRHDYRHVGNRLDKLFQSANDGCTNGLPIGPAVSDLIAEVILAAIDRELSKKLADDVVVVRFKDDYRILAKTAESGRSVVKLLQAAAREYRLELHDEKTEFHNLPDGLFRKWVSQYHLANPRPKAPYGFKRFKEVCLSVVAIDRANPGCGVIDRFMADIVRTSGRLRVRVRRRELPKVISMLLMVAAHPKELLQRSLF